jgi:membrane dipeptidase
LIGADYIGLGSDFDGVLETPEGLEDTSKYPDLFDLLAEDGHGWMPWSDDELKKLAGMNFIRVFKDVEAVRDSMKDVEIIDDPIPYDEVFSANAEAKVCRTDLEKFNTKRTPEVMQDEASEGSG